jgi:hypothetical protein
VSSIGAFGFGLSQLLFVYIICGAAGLGRRARPRVGAADAGAVPQLGITAAAAARDRSAAPATERRRTPHPGTIADRTASVGAASAHAARAVVLALVALAFYVAFILMAVMTGTDAARESVRNATAHRNLTLKLHGFAALARSRSASRWCRCTTCSAKSPASATRSCCSSAGDRSQGARATSARTRKAADGRRTSRRRAPSRSSSSPNCRRWAAGNSGREVRSMKVQPGQALRGRSSSPTTSPATTPSRRPCRTSRRAMPRRTSARPSASASRRRSSRSGERATCRCASSSTRAAGVHRPHHACLHFLRQPARRRAQLTRDAEKMAIRPLHAHGHD